MNAITGECNLVFDTRIAIDNVMLKYHNTIENDDMAILEFEYLGNGHKEVLLRNGKKVSEDIDNVSMFYSITDISENLFSYDRGDEIISLIDLEKTNLSREKLEVTIVYGTLTYWILRQIKSLCILMLIVCILVRKKQVTEK
jgi:hypothetical protein